MVACLFSGWTMVKNQSIILIIDKNEVVFTHHLGEFNIYGLLADFNEGFGNFNFLFHLALLQN
jgi:hypothetical protein